MEWVFHGADTNSNQALDQQEVANLLVAVYEMGGIDTRHNKPDIEGFFKRIDATEVKIREKS
jgi:hypothetical protein